jgi:hypothetical protein
MELENGLNSLTIDSMLYFLFEGGLILFFILYLLFALVVIKQVNLMTDTVITEEKNNLKLFSRIHAVVVLLIIIIYLVTFMI